MASALFPSTRETTNYARLCRLLIDVGTEVLREVFDRIHPSIDLHKVLAQSGVKSKLQALLKRRKLNPSQWNILYPTSTTVSSADFDVTLLMVLFRNICNLPQPGTGWDDLPTAADTSLEADIARVKFYRNTVYAHVSNASIDDTEFTHYWQEIRETLVRLGGAGSSYGDTIDRLANESMDPEKEKFYQELLKTWWNDEFSLKVKLDEIDEKLSDFANPKKRTRSAEPFDLKQCQKELHSFYRTICKVKIIPWKPKSAVCINEIYTKLSWQREESKPSEDSQEELEDYTDMFKSCGPYDEPNRILVFGPPGIGKTTFAKRVVFDWLHQAKEILKKFELVLFVRLRDVCELQTLSDILTAAKLLPADGMISVESLYEYIQWNQEKVLLVLDGFDEYFCAECSPVRNIWEGSLLRGCSVIVTTRLEGADELTERSHVECQINGFVSGIQLRNFARKFLKDEEVVAKFEKHLEEKGLRKVAEIPLLLVMLCLLWKEEGHKGHLKSRASIYMHFIQMLLDHMTAKEPHAKKFRKVDDYKEDLLKLGKLAFDALKQGSLSMCYSELPDDILTKKLIEVGLFQSLNVSSLKPEKEVFFIHKSVQEFLAAWYVKEELASSRNKSPTCLPEDESSEKVLKMTEVIKFVNEMSGEASSIVLKHLETVAKRERLTENILSETPSFEDLSEKRRHFLALCSHSYFCLSVEKRKDLYCLYLSCTGGILLIDSDQLHVIASEHLLKYSQPPNYVFFTDSKHPKENYSDLITVLEDVNGTLVSSSGEVEASMFLRKYNPQRVEQFFLKKENNSFIYLYFAYISKNYDHPLPIEMLQDVTRSPEFTQIEKTSVGDRPNGPDNTAFLLSDDTERSPVPPRHCLSLTSEIHTKYLEEQEMKTLITALPHVIFPRVMTMSVPVGKLYDALILENLLSRLNFTNRLDTLEFCRCNITAGPAAAIARSFHKAPNLRELYLSYNPLGDGLNTLMEHLHCVQRLETLRLGGVKMTKEQVEDLTRAVRQSNITSLGSYYHDEQGNPKPEHEWPADELWKGKWWYKSEDEVENGTEGAFEPKSEERLKPGTEDE